jgi:8-oxo-dGTP diphosphatase
MSEKHQKITVGGLLIVDNKVLVVKRSAKEKNFSGLYELPGGKVDFGEHPVQSLKREFMEETNLEIKIDRPYRIFTYLSHEGIRHIVEIVYVVKLDDSIENIKLSDEHDDYKWLASEEIDDYKMSDDIKINIRQGFDLIKNE